MFTRIELYSSSKIHVCFSLIGKTSLSNLRHAVLPKKCIKEKERKYTFYFIQIQEELFWMTLLVVATL